MNFSAVSHSSTLWPNSTGFCRRPRLINSVCGSDRLKTRSLAGNGPAAAVAPPAAPPPLDQRAEVRFSLPLARLRLARHVPRDVQVQPFDPAIVETVRHAFSQKVPRPLQQPCRHPPCVPQQRRAGRVMDVRLHHRRVRAGHLWVHRSLRNSILAKMFVDPLPSFRFDGEEALVQEGEVHDGPLPHPQKILQEPVAANADDRIAEGQPLDVLADQRPEDVLRGEVAIAAPGVACGELQDIPVDCRKDLGIIVEHLTDGTVSFTVVAYDLGQPIVIGLETQHGFLLSTHPCSPWRLSKRCCHQDKDASFLYKPGCAAFVPKPSATETKYSTWPDVRSRSCGDDT